MQVLLWIDHLVVQFLIKLIDRDHYKTRNPKKDSNFQIDFTLHKLDNRLQASHPSSLLFRRRSKIHFGNARYQTTIINLRIEYKCKLKSLRKAH